MFKLWQKLIGHTAVAPSAPVRARQASPTPVAQADPPPHTLAPDPDVSSIAMIQERFRRFVLGLPVLESVTGSPGEQQLLKRLQARANRFEPASLPRLPTVLPQLLRSLKSESVSGAQLAELVGRDPVLVGEVMRVSSSSYYRTVHPIVSLQHAVVLLGQEGLRRVVTLHVMKPIMQASAGMFSHVAADRLWQQAERCAHACAHLARHGGEPFEAYLAGIVCNAGSGALMRLLDAETSAQSASFSAEFLDGCARISARISLKVGRHWQLPPRVLTALQEHVDLPEKNSELGDALLCADVLAMAQLLGEEHLLDSKIDLAGCWSGRFKPERIARCQDDLRRHFHRDELARVAVAGD